MKARWIAVAAVAGGLLSGQALAQTPNVSSAKVERVQASSTIDAKRASVQQGIKRAGPKSTGRKNGFVEPNVGPIEPFIWTPELIGFAVFGGIVVGGAVYEATRDDSPSSP